MHSQFTSTIMFHIKSCVCLCTGSSCQYMNMHFFFSLKNVLHRDYSVCYSCVFLTLCVCMYVLILCCLVLCSWVNGSECSLNVSSVLKFFFFFFYIISCSREKERKRAKDKGRDKEIERKRERKRERIII